MTNKNTIKKAFLVQQILNEHYEAGRQDRCKGWVLKHIVQNTYPMSRRTFFRYLNTVTNCTATSDQRQMQLF